MTKVLIACGASGGHIFPAVALGASLRKKIKDIDMLFVGSRRYLDRKIFLREKLRFKSLSSNKLPYGFSLSLPIVGIRFVFDIMKSIYIVWSFAPHVIVGFGGYVSFPVLIVGRMMGIPTVVHEQNVIPGRANLILFSFADVIALSFEETARSMTEGARKKVVLTGNPIRKDMLKDDRELALKKFGFDRDKFTILAIGGSQGAHRLNRVFSESIVSMKDEVRKRIQVIHIAGEKDRFATSAMYDNSGVSNHVFSFIDSIDEAYSLADLVFTRSGAAALFELAFYAKPMVLVPYPYAMSHQRENALVFSKNGAAIYKEEKDLDPKELSLFLIDLMGDQETLKRMSESSRKMSRPGAADLLADAVIAIERKR